MYMGAYYDSWINKESHGKWTFLWPLFLCGASVLLILFGGDFGSAALMSALFALVFMSIPSKEKPIKIIKGIALCGLVFCVFVLKFLHLVVPQEEEEMKDVLAKHFAKKVDDEMDALWNEGKINMDVIEEWSEDNY